MGINTILRHLESAKKELCFRTLENLRNQGVSVGELRAQCQKRGWVCVEHANRILIAKTEAAHARALTEGAVGHRHCDPNELREPVPPSMGAKQTAVASHDVRNASANADFEGRLALLSQPHVAPLSNFRVQLLKDLPKNSFVPNFDPKDGGIEARVLLLLETPGRVPRATQFTSLDNPSMTSMNLLPMVMGAGLKRSEVLMWNLVPWDIGTETKIKSTTSNHHSVGTAALLRLLKLLPQLRVIVFFGTKAQVALKDVQVVRSDLLLLRSPHPSPSNLNTRPESRQEILVALTSAASALSDGEPFLHADAELASVLLTPSSNAEGRH